MSPSFWSLMMAMKNKAKYFFLAALIIIILDQTTKVLILNHFGIVYNSRGEFIYTNPQHDISILGDTVQLTFVDNEGMAFGVKFGGLKIILSTFSIVASILLGWYLYRLEGFSIWVRIGIMLIFIGAVGNLIDRVFYGVIFGYSPIMYGKVIDFVQVDIPDIDIGPFYYTHFPVFNVADSCVTCGVILLLIVHKRIPPLSLVFGKKNSTEPVEDNDEELSKSADIDVIEKK